MFLVCDEPDFVPNSNWTTQLRYRLLNGTTRLHIINYVCNEDYYSSNGLANLAFMCVLGARWIPKQPISCVKGIYKGASYNISVNTLVF